MASCAYCKIEETHLYENGVPVCLKCANIRDSKPNRDIHAILVKALCSATTKAEAASVEFNAVMGNRTLHPEGSEHITKASRELSAARNTIFIRRPVMTAPGGADHGDSSVFG